MSDTRGDFMPQTDISEDEAYAKEQCKSCKWRAYENCKDCFFNEFYEPKDAAQIKEASK